MDNLNDYEDIGEKIGIDGESVYMSDSFSPNFKSRHTIQLWKVISKNPLINKWVGETLAGDSLHEIYIKNTLQEKAVLTFFKDYELSDEYDLHKISIDPNETAHFYCTGAYIGDTLTLVMRTGSQDTRK